MSEYLLYIQGVLFLIMPVTRVIFGISKESTCLWYFISSPLSFFLKIQFFVSCHLPSTLRTSFSVFYSVDLLVFFQWKGLLVDIPWFSVTESDFIFQHLTVYFFILEALVLGIPFNTSQTQGSWKQRWRMQPM